MAGCCECTSHSNHNNVPLPLICMVPRQNGGGRHATETSEMKARTCTGEGQNTELLDDEYLKKHFNLPKRAMYLDPFSRPLITFPMTQDMNKHFSVLRKQKINQQILDGYLDPSQAITAPSVFPYAKCPEEKKKQAAAEQDDELIYILQLPDSEYTCPVHKETIRTPRFIWHSCKKTKEPVSKEPKRGLGPLHKPKPWLLSRHTDCDFLSQW